MGRAEIIILTAIILTALGAFSLEQLGADAARVVGIGFCLLLVLSLVLGLIVRVRVKRHREAEALAAWMEAQGEEADSGSEPSML